MNGTIVWLLGILFVAIWILGLAWVVLLIDKDLKEIH